MGYVLKEDGTLWQTVYDGCCIQWLEAPEVITFGSYVTADSTLDPFIEPYEPYISPENEYYVPFNYDPEMPDPKQLIDIADAPSLTAMDYFVGTNATGDYKFTPAQLIAYVAPMLRLPYEVEITGETITVADIASKPVQAIMLPNGTLTKSQFTQVNNDITYTGNSFYAGDNIVFIF